MRKKKILLAFEEYGELARLQKDLMRLGFDVVGTQSEHQLQKELIEFNPELIMISTRNQKLSFQAVVERIRTASLFRGIVFLLVTQGFQIDPKTLAKVKIDAILPAQIEFKLLIQKLCEALRLDATKMLEKLQKLESSGQAIGVAHRAKSFTGHQKEESIMISGKMSYAPRDYRSIGSKVEQDLAREGFKVDPQTTTFDDPRLEKIRREIRAEAKESGGPSGAFGPDGQVPSLDQQTSSFREQEGSGDDSAASAEDSWFISAEDLKAKNERSEGSGLSALEEGDSKLDKGESSGPAASQPPPSDHLRELKMRFVRGLVRPKKE